MKLFARSVLLMMLCTCPAVGQGYSELRKHSTEQAHRLLREGKYQQSIQLFEKLLKAARQVKDTNTLYRTHYEIGNIYYQLEKFSLSVAELNASLQWARQKRQVPARELIKLYMSLSNSYIETNQKDSSRYFALKAYQVLSKSPSEKKQLGQALATMFINQASVEIDEKSFDIALNYLNKAQGLIGGDRFFQSMITSYYASIYQKTNVFIKADSCLQLAIRQYPRKDGYLVWLYLLAGKTYLQYEFTDKARQAIDEANKLYLQMPPSEQGSDLQRTIFLRYGQLYARQRQDSAAVGAFQRAISISTKQYGKRGTVPAEAYRELAQLYRRKDQMPQALGAIQRALVAASTTFDSQDLGQNPNAEDFQLGVPLMEALHLKAELLLSAKRGAGALDTYRRYVEVALAVRREISSQESRLFFQQNRVDEVFNEAISLAFVRRDAEAAFWLIEQSRAATLHDRLSEQALKPRHIPAAVLKQENDLQGTIARLKMELSQGSNPQKEVALREAYLALEQLGLEWAQQYPEYFAERRAVTSLTLRALQKRLPNDMAYVAWHVAPNHLYTLIVTTQDTQLRVAQVSRRELDQQIVALRRALDQNPKVGAYAGSKPSQWLYAVLLKPIQATLQDTKRLVVSSNGKLNLLPIDVLEYAPGRYCVERFAMSKAYNASIHFAEHGSDWLKTKPSLLVFAPFARPSGMQVGRSGDTLGPLPATLQECRKLGGTMYINQNAQKVDFLEAHRQKSTTSESVVYHFATHSVGNDAKPEASFVAFHPSPNAEYRLYSAEIKQLNLSNVRLAVLNSCSSAYGQLLENEGILSLARAFTEAGCRAVAAALWTEDDATGSAIAVSFHQYLAQGIPTDVALQKAKLDYLNNPPDDAFRDMRHPYFWGAMILSGHVEAVYESYLVWWWYGLGLAGLMGAGVWWWRRRKLKGPVNNPQG